MREAQLIQKLGEFQESNLHHSSELQNKEREIAVSVGKHIYHMRISPMFMKRIRKQLTAAKLHMNVFEELQKALEVQDSNSPTEAATVSEVLCIQR
jgi:hypothetical protein